MKYILDCEDFLEKIKSRNPIVSYDEVRDLWELRINKQTWHHKELRRCLEKCCVFLIQVEAAWITNGRLTVF